MLIVPNTALPLDKWLEVKANSENVEKLRVALVNRFRNISKLSMYFGKTDEGFPVLKDSPFVYELINEEITNAGLRGVFTLQNRKDGYSTSLFNGIRVNPSAQTLSTERELLRIGDMPKNTDLVNAYKKQVVTYKNNPTVRMLIENIIFRNKQEIKQFKDPLLLRNQVHSSTGNGNRIVMLYIDAPVLAYVSSGAETYFILRTSRMTLGYQLLAKRNGMVGAYRMPLDKVADIITTVLDGDISRFAIESCGKTEEIKTAVLTEVANVL
jgi:hypothetical protein